MGLILKFKKLFNEIAGKAPTFSPEFNYDDYWKKREETGYRERYRAINDLMESGSTLLDIGCGDGSALEYFISNGKVADHLGVDIGQAAIDKASAKGLNVRLLDVSKETDSLPEVDYIVMSELIEHIPMPEKLLSLVKKKFKKALFVTVPNTGYFAYRLRLLLGRFPVQWVQHPGEHLRFWTISDFHKWADAVGYRIVKTAPVDGVERLNLRALWPAMFATTMLYVLKEK